MQKKYWLIRKKGLSPHKKSIAAEYLMNLRAAEMSGNTIITEPKLIWGELGHEDLNTTRNHAPMYTEQVISMYRKCME